MAAAASLCRFLNLWGFVFLVVASLACSLTFDLPSIGPKDTNTRINVWGDAYITTQGIQLTPAEYEREMVLSYKAGRATYVELFHLWDKATGELADFTTHFTFNINSRGSSSFADGLAFFLANFSIPFNTIDTGGGGLGLMDRALVTSPDLFVAVVFDTFSNQKSIPLTSVTINVKTWNRSVAKTEWQNDITKGKDNNATITYSATSKLLRVDFTQFSDGHYSANSLIWQIDLRDYLPEFVSIGFSGATSVFWEKNTVKSWQFDSTPLSHIVNPERKKKKGVKKIAVGLSIGGVLILLALLVLALAIFYFKKKRRAAQGNNQNLLDPEVEMVDNQKAMDSEFEKATGPKKYTYSELANATYYFSKELGEGGFGKVYEGKIGDMKVAVKKVSKGCKQGIKEYASEVKIISQLKHKNLVKLHGWCHDKRELLLVYEYMSEGSLDSHLFNRQPPLKWRVRYRIAQGLASAVSYLHEDGEQCVLHRDIKSSNVLLSSKFAAKLGDFGLAWQIDHEKTRKKTMSGFTPGYLAPECIRTGKTSIESDVYSFGIVALEIATGQSAIACMNKVGISLVEWVWNLHGMGELLKAADPKLHGKFDKDEMYRLLMMGLWCAHPDDSERPKMRKVVNRLNIQSPFRMPFLPKKMPKDDKFQQAEFEYHTISSHNIPIASAASSSSPLLRYTN